MKRTISRRKSAEQPDNGAGGSRWVKPAILMVIVIGAVLVAKHAGWFALSDRHQLAAAVSRAREYRGIVPGFVAVYALVSTFGLPATPLTLAGGAMFGVVEGSLLNWIGAVLGACGAYFATRFLGADAFRTLIGKWSSKLGALDGRRGFATIFRLRLLPVVPFNVLNFAAGVSGVRFRPYLAGTALGIIPGTIIYTYFADSLLGGVTGASRNAFVKLAIAAALLLSASFAPALWSRFRGSKA